MKKSSDLLKYFRRHFKRPVTIALALFLPLWTVQVRGATLSWDGSDGPWDLVTTQWDGNSSLWVNGSDLAFFGGTSGTVTLSVPITAGGLIFDSDGYVITGNTLTLVAPAGLNSPAISVSAFNRATIDSIIAGTSGITKTGNGTLKLGNSANSFSGDVVINGGALVITDQAQLGTGTTTISVNGLANTGNPGFSGGTLVLHGGLAGMTINRGISVTGRGPGAANGTAGLVSVGNNTLGGNLVVGSTGTEGRVLATHGITTVTGGVQLGTGAANLFYGNGNWIVSGVMTGFDTAGDRLIKTGNLIGTTLWLQNANNNFAQPLRIDSGTVRVSTAGALGLNAGTQHVDLNGATLEVLTDASDFSGITVRKRGNGGGIFVDHALGSTVINQSVAFGNLLLDANASFVLSGRNGYGATFTGLNGTINWTNGGTGAFTNNSSGLLTVNANINRLSETTARVFTFAGNGDMLMTGNLLQVGTGAVSLSKTGTGTLTLQGMASTATGSTTIGGGTLVISDFAGLPAGALNIGNATTTAGALTYIGAGETSSKAILLNTTTANVFINASGSGALTLSGAITAVAGTKTLVLGGTNTGDNTISSALPATATTNLQKVGVGTWVLSGANLHTGSTTVSNGTLKIQDTFSGGSRNVLPNAGAVIFNLDTLTQSAGGIFQYLGDVANASAETVGALTPTAGAGTIMVTAGSGGTAALTFSSLGTVSAGSGVNFVTNAGGSVVLSGAADVNGILNAHLYYNGADFAAGSAVGAATYTTEAGGVSLAGANTLPYLVNTTDIAAQATATINAGIKFNDTRNFTLGAAQTLTIQNGAATVAGGILVTGGSSVVISGGTGITTGGAADLVFRTDAVGDTLTLNTAITATTTGGWTKLGAGTLIIGAANANTTAGAVNINEGTVRLAAGGKLGADSIDVNLRQGAVLDLNGVDLGTVASGVGSLDFLNGAGTITNSAAATTASIRIGNGNTGSYFSGLIENGAGTVALVKNGSGTIHLAGLNTFTGPVTLSAGNLDVTRLANIGTASGLGMGDATDTASNAASLVFNGGSLRYVGTNAAGAVEATQTPSVSINRLFTLAGNGGIYSYGSYGNVIAVRAANHAALVFNNTGAVAFSGAGARTLTLGGDSLGDNLLNLQLINNPNANEALSLTKSDGSLWILGNTANSYSGNTTINGGVLRVGDDGSALTRTLPTTSALVLGLTTGAGILQTSGTFTRGIAATATANRVTFGGTTGGGGFAASTAPLKVNLGGVGATLQWGVGGFVGTGGTQTLFLSSSTSWADVDFQNGIDLNGSTRTIQVDDNGNTGLDYATISGVISNSTGTGSLDFTGGGTLILGDANTYNGNTRILSSGALIVSSIGNSSGTTASSLGASGGALSFIGNATQQLLYVGAGETADRPITFTTALSAARTYRIDSSGSGALVLENFSNNKTGNFTMFMELRGTNTDGNAINSVIGNGSGTAGLVLAKFDSGVWILGNTANTFTGGVRADGGLLGLAANGSLGVDGVVTTGSTSGSSTTLTVASTAGLTPGMYVNGAGITYGDIITAVGAGTVTLSTARTVAAGTVVQFGGLNISNGGIFATDPAGLTITQPVFLNNNSTSVFAGFNPITINSDVKKGAGANDNTLSNNLEGGAVLTINGNYVNLQNAAATRNLNVRGFGSTVWNGVIQDFGGTSLTRLDIRIADTASFTLGGANTLTGGILLGQGTLIVSNVAGLGPAANNIILDGGVLTSTVDLTGANKVLNRVQLAGDQTTINGSQNIEFGGAVALENFGGNRFLRNNLDVGKTLTISGQVNLTETTTARTLTLRGSGDTVISGVVANGGTGASGLAFSGTGSLLMTGANTATGTLTINRNMVTLSGTSGGSWNSGSFALNPIGVLRLDNSGGDNAAGRLNDAGAFAGNGGTLDIIGSSTGTTENAGALTLNSVQTFITMTDNTGGLGTNTLTFASVNFANTGSSLNLAGIADLGTINKIMFTAALAANAQINSVMPRTFIAGGNFATYDVTDGVKAFANYNPTSTTNINLAGATDTVEVNAGMTTSNLTASKTVNAVKINGSGLTITSTGNRVLTLGAAALLNTGGNNTLAASQVAFGGNTGYFQVDSGTTLTVDSVLTGTAGMVNARSGTLVLNTPMFVTSTTNLLKGTLKLNGGLNTLFPNQIFNLNDGATLDLNGNTQYVGQFTDPGTLPDSGGSIISSAGTGTFVTNMAGGSASIAGTLSGSVNFARVGGNTLTFDSANSYNGSTTIMGGTLELQNDATILNTSSIEINNATLTLNNNSALQRAIYDRVGDTTPITLRGGTISFAGKVSDPATETMGALTAAQGANTITVATGGTGTAGAFASADVTFASLTRTPGVTINFTGSTALGSIGNFPRIYFTTPLSTFGDGVLGAWAISNSSDYAAYNTANGIGTVGNGGYAGYSATFGSGSITDLNAVSTAITTTLSADTTAALLRLSGAFTNDIAFTTGTEVLNLELGGILRSNNNNAASFGTTALRGVLTAGGTETSGTRELVIYSAATGTANFTGGATTAASNVITMTSTGGLSPGMTVTNANLPAGTYIVSVDDATTVTVSQNATATAATLTFVGGVNNVIINSVIANNGLGNSVQLVKSGAGVLNLSANNTYTGGTVVSQGTLNLIGSGVVLPAGGLTITNAIVTMLTNNGQIAATNAVTLNGSSTLTLAGGAGLNNTLASITFNNNGGITAPTVTNPANSILTLTSSSPVTVTTSNAATLPVISGGFLALNSGANTFNIGAPTVAGQIYTQINAALNITSVITGTGASITKTGAGLLQLSGQNIFNGGIDVQAGGLLLAANSTATVPNTLVSGPLGLGTVSFASGTTLLVDNTDRTVANAMSFAGDPVFNNVGTTLRTVTLNGALSFATQTTTGLVVNIPTPFLNVVLGGPIANIGSVTAIGGTGANTITKTGVGNLTGINLTGVGSSVPIDITSLSNNTFALLHDGDGTGSLQTINLGAITWEPAISGTALVLTVNRAGSGVYFPTALYKTIAPASLTSSQLGNGITLTNGSNYGLLLVDDITFNTVAADTGPTFSVSALNTSLQPVGLTLNGLLTGGPTGATARVLIKAGAGVLTLGDATNSFGGGGSIIDITDGLIQVASDGALGDSANIVRISANNLAEGLRVTGTFATSREINLNGASSGIDVTGSNIFTLNSAFTFATATHALRKNDRGTLVLTQAQPGWDGVLTIGQGVLRITDGAALGTTTGNLILANVGAALELDGSGGNITVADPIRIASTNNSSSNGINGGGAIRSTAGTNTLTGAITIDTTTTDANSRSGTLTADLASILNVEGGIVLGIGTAGSNRDNWIGFGGEGTINLTTTGITHTGNLVADGLATLNKFGSGILNIQVANAYSGDRVVVKSGTLSLNGTGTLGVPGAGGGTGDVYLNPTGILTLDNSGSNVNNRLSGRNFNVSGADLNIIGNSAAATSETVGAFTLREGSSYFTLTADAAQQLDFTTGTLTRSAQATLIVRGSNFGSAAGAGVATMKGGAYPFIGQLGATSATNKSILPWAFGDTNLTGGGTFFLTADSADAGANTGTNILRPLTGAEQTTHFATALANVNLSTSEALSSLTTFNSLRLDSGGGVMLNYVPLTLDSGGMLVLAGNTGITGFSGVSYLTTTSNRELLIHNLADITLTVPMAGTTGQLTKSGAGTLTLTAGNVSHGTVMVNDGILKLGGGDQTLQVNRNLFVNEGATLDLFGTVQNVGILESRQSAVLARNDGHTGGGTVINTSGSQATLAMTTASSIFAGTIGNGNVGESNIAVMRSTAAGGSVDWNLYANQTYTGPTLYNGGRVILNHGARLSATSSIEVTNATLLISASNAATEPIELTDRINDAASITLRGAMLQLRSLAALYMTETFGAVTLGEGNTFIDFAEGGTAVNQVDATFASLARQAGSRATVRFVNIDAQPSALQRLFINNLNGVATTNIGDGLTNHLIGGWATFEREFASYTPGQGVGGLATGGFAGYSPLIDPNLGTATDNIRILLPTTGSTTLLTGNVTLNSFNMQANTGATDDSTLNLGGNTLTLASGGLILSPVATTALLNSINVVNGNLTAGTTSSPADLYLNVLAWFNGQADITGNADVTVSANIVNNGAGGVVTLVIAGATGRGALAATNDVLITGNNTYTGGTFVNSGQVRLNNTTADGITNFAVPGNLTIAGGYGNNSGALFNDRTTTVILDNPDQISHAATVTVMGGAILNLNNLNQTLAGLIFNNHGGTTPQVTTGTGTLTLDGNLTASGQNLGATSQIDGKLKFSAATATITVDPVQWNSEILNPLLPNLTINAPIEGGDIIKAGDGILRLNGSNAFAGGLEIQAGGILLGSNLALSGGLLTIGDNTFLSSTADNRVIANSFNVSGDFALRDIFNLTMSGAGLLASGNHTVAVDSATKVLTLSGIITGADGTSGITKTGNGILVLGNNSNSYGGATTVADGVLRYGAVDAIPTGTAMTVLEGALLDITTGGTAVTVGSLAGNSATQGGLVFHGATSGTLTFTAGGDGSSTSFGGIIANAAGSTLNLVKTGVGTLTLGGANLYNGSTAVVNGRLVARAVGGNSPLGTSQSLILGGGSTSGILQLGDSSTALSHTFTSLASQGSGTANQIVSGNASMATLTLDIATTTLFFGNVGGAGANEANLHLVKNGVGDLAFAGTGTSTFVGSTTVNGGKLFMNTPGAFSTTTTSLTLADGTEFSLRGTTNAANQIYGFSGTGNKITVGTTTGATLGFALDGGFNSRLNLVTGQTLTVNGTLTTAIYVNSAPVSLQDYVLINGVDTNSLHAGAGTFDLNPVIFNGGSFTYALRFDSGIGGGGLDQWVLTPTAVPAAADTWWKGDLGGLGLGVWSATTTSGTGFPSNWDTDQTSGIDALVPPDLNSIVHFSATGAANFTTTLGAHLTIQQLIFHTGNAATTIGSSNGVNTLTLGNTVDTSGITLETGVGDVGVSVGVGLAQNQSWNIEDSVRTLTLSGGLTGTSRTLTLNDAVTNAGSLILSGTAGTAGTLTGTVNVNAGSLIFEDTGSLNSGADVVLGTATKAATLKVGNTTAATDAVIGGLSNGTFAGSAVIGGNATMSTLTIGPASGSATFTGALGGVGTNENQFNLSKAGAGTQILSGAITYAGTTTVREGILQLGSSSTFAPTGALSVIANAGTTATFDFNGKSFTTIGTTTLGGGANGIAQILDTNGTKGIITLGGDIVYDALNDPGAAVISVNLVGTGGNRTITVGESVNAATDLTLSGTFVSSANNNLTFAGAGNGLISGNMSLTGGTTSDVNFSSTGTWTITAKIEAQDIIQVNTGVVNATVGESLDATNDVVIDGTGIQGSAVVNISSTAQVHTGDDFFIQNGGLVFVTSNGGIGTGTDQLLIGNSASASAAAAGRLDLAANISVGTNGILVGNGTSIGNITGSGIITTTGTKQLGNGTIEAGITLAGNGAITKNSTGTLTFFGARDGASTGATNIQEGGLILDYTLNNNSKIGGVLNIGLLNNLGVRSLVVIGSDSATTSQSVTSTTVLPGSTTVTINNGAGQTALLDLNAITRTQTGGLIFFEYSSTDAKATSTNAAGTLGWATLVIGAGLERFAAIDGVGDIVQATFTTQNNVALWAAGQNIINSGAYTGVVSCAQIDSLTFAANAASTVTIGAGSHLIITSGGIMVDSAVGAFDMNILGGSLYGSTSSTRGEVIVHQNNAVGTLTIGSSILNSSGITKTGTGTLLLTGSNTFLSSGSRLHIDEGVVQLGGGSALGDTTSILMRAGTTLNLNNSNETVGHLVTTSGTVTIALSTSGQLTLNQTASTTYTGIFTGGATSVFTLNNLGFNFNISATTTTGFTGSVVINSGLLQLSGSGRLANAAAFTINKGANLLLDNNGTTLSGDRILNTATITLNSADGVFGGQTIVRGLALRTDQDGTLDETVGVVTVASGANYLAMEATTVNDDSDIIAANLLRTNKATFNVRGTNLGSTNVQNNQFRIATGANETAFISALVGGGGAAASQNISIVPWAIGQATAGALTDTHMGDSLVTYDIGAGLRPLSLTTEYDTLALAAPTDNVRESLSASLTGVAGTTVNSLVIHKNSTGAGTINVTGAGAGNALINTSGTFLFTQNTGAAASSVHSVILGGFDDGIQTGASNEYVFFVVNPSSAANTATLTATVSSPLNTSAASVTKSGRGTLEFTAVNTYSGGTTVNEGVLLIHDTDNIGTGGLTLAGGTLRLAADFADDLGSRSLTVLSGGGTLDVLAASVIATDLALSGSGNLVKTGTGTLQLTGTTATTHTGLVTVNAGILELNNSSGNAIGTGGLFISGTTNPTTVRLLAGNQIADTAAVALVNNGSTNQLLDLNDFSDTLGSVSMTATSNAGTVIKTGAAGVLTVTGDITLNANRVNDGGTTEFQTLITGSGNVGTRSTDGTLNLGGATRTITVQTVVAVPNRNDAVIETVITNGGIVKEGAQALYLRAANTYTDGTSVNDGRLEVSGSLSTGAVIVSETGGTLANAAVLAGAGDGITTGIIGGAVTLGEMDSGAICGVGVLTPGLTTAAGVNTNGTLTISAAGLALTVNDGSQIQFGITTATVISDGLVAAFGEGTATSALDYLQNAGAGEIASWNSAAGNRDYINLNGTSSSLSIGSRASAAFGQGAVVVSGAGLGTPVLGQVFNLIDWTSLANIGGSFGTGGSLIYDASSNVSAGDLDLVALGTGFAWDVSAFAQYGLVVVVPEPSRILLLLCGLLGLLLRRRRRPASI